MLVRLHSPIGSPSRLTQSSLELALACAPLRRPLGVAVPHRELALGTGGGNAFIERTLYYYKTELNPEPEAEPEARP